MRNFVLMALGAIAMASCAQNDENLLNKEPVEIRLNAEIASSVGTRAVINPKDAVTNVQFARIDGETPDWTTIAAIELTGDITANTGVISFATVQHYPSTGNAANLLAYYPAAKSLAAGVASMEITGTQDVMHAAPVSGTKLVPITDNIQLRHLLTQFTFVVKRDASTSADVSNVEIAINGANTTFDMALANGALSNWATPVSTIKPMTAGVATLLGSTATSGIMLEPGMSAIELQVSADGYAGQPITINGTDSGQFEAGKSYEITLTFKGSAIEPSAAIDEWTSGTGGSEDIQ